MGKIAASYDLMPKSIDVSLDDIINELEKVMPAGVKIIETKIQPVAFGLKKVNVGLLIDDSDDTIGGSLEEALRSIRDVENVECVANTLL